jgi:hypothetical protein
MLVTEKARAKITINYLREMEGRNLEILHIFVYVLVHFL